MPLLWIAVGAFAGSQLKDGIDTVTGEDNSLLGGMSLPVMGLAAFGAYMVWKKVK